MLRELGILLILTFSALHVNGQNYNVIFEKAELLGYNKEYGRLGGFSFGKYNRTTVALNTTFTVLREVDSLKLRVRLLFSKFYSNKYLVVPTRIQFMLCKAWKDNKFGIQDLKRASNFDLCHIEKDVLYHVDNYTPNFKYPPYAPLGRYRVEVILDYGELNAFGMAWYVKLTPK